MNHLKLCKEEKNMFSQGLRSIACLVLGFCLLAPVAARADGDCDVETLKGSYAFEANGFLLLGKKTVPTAAIGDFTFGGVGNVVGTATQSVNGTIVQIPQAGIYTINPDCSGSVVTNGNDGITRTFDVIILRQGKEIVTLATRPELVSAFTLNNKQKSIDYFYSLPYRCSLASLGNWPAIDRRYRTVVLQSECIMAIHSRRFNPQLRTPNASPKSSSSASFTKVNDLQLIFVPFLVKSLKGSKRPVRRQAEHRASYGLEPARRSERVLCNHVDIPEVSL
jgi:hypothetical protein